MTARTRKTENIEDLANEAGKHAYGGSDRDTSGRKRKCRPTSGSVVALFQRNGFVNHDPGLLRDETLVVLIREGLAAAAERKSMSKRTFRRRIRKTGTTVSQIVRSTRRMLSLRLIRRGGRMSKISSWLGYDSARCFARFVRREFGESPTEIRKRLRQAEEFD